MHPRTPFDSGQNLSPALQRWVTLSWEVSRAWERLPGFLQRCSLLPRFLGRAGSRWHVWVKSLPCLLYCFASPASFNFFFFPFIPAFVPRLPRRPCVHRAGWGGELPGAQVACCRSQKNRWVVWYWCCFCGDAWGTDLFWGAFSLVLPQSRRCLGRFRFDTPVAGTAPDSGVCD